METLGLLSKPMSDDTAKEVDFYIVPSMLNKNDPEVIQAVLSGPAIVRTSTLCLQFDNPFIPQALSDKTIAACIHRFQPLTEPGHDRSKFIQRGFVCLTVDYLWNMILNSQDSAIKITMFKRDNDNYIHPGSGVNLRKIIEYLLRGILEMSHQSHLRYSYYLHNDYRFADGDIMVKAENLLKQPSLSCHGPLGPDWITREDYEVWFQDSKRKKSPRLKTSEHIPREVTCTSISPAEIGRVSRFIGGTYLTFFTELDCPIYLVEQTMEEYRHLAFRTRITKILLLIVHTRPDVGLTEIADAMEKRGMDPMDLLTVQDENRDTTFRVVDLPERSLQKLLTSHDVPIIADQVDIKAYFNLFLELGFPPQKIDEFDDHYRHKPARVKIVALLKAWIMDSRRGPCVNAILLAMSECDMDTVSLVTALHLQG